VRGAAMIATVTCCAVNARLQFAATTLATMPRKG
jgi:hypothetical protein